MFVLLLSKGFASFLFLLNVAWSASFQLSHHHPSHQRSQHMFGHFAVDTSKDNGGSEQQHDDYENQEQIHAASVSASLLDAMRHGTAGPDDDCSLHLATDLFDRTTGLHSEGVWHNALAGIASLRLRQTIPAQRIVDSLWKYSWDGTSFRRRAYSGNWDHSSALLESIEQANYYRPSTEHRCVQHGMALVLWSEFVLSNSTTPSSYYKEQERLVAKAFRDEFWDDSVGRWMTVGASQGGGTLLRPSASAGRVTLNATEAVPYYRAVDQAVGVLACLAHLEVLRKGEPDNTECEDVIHIIQTTCSEPLEAFGYAHEETARTYIGLNRNRNFWHDGWVALALISARQYIWPANDASTGEKELRILLERLIYRYGHGNARHEFDGTIWHWPGALKADDDNVRYCGDNVLLYAIARCLDWVPGGLEEYQSGFWDFVGKLRSREDDGLASVADVYKQVRLHPNTELAALLVWP